MRRQSNFWWISFTETPKLFDDERQVTEAEWVRHAPAKDAMELKRELERRPELVVAMPKSG